MPVEVRVPQLGESVVEATISRIFKQPGEAVNEDDVLLELETDKVNVEVPAGVTGMLESLAHKEGETVGVNDILAVVTEQGAANGNGASATPAAPNKAEAPVVESRAPIPAENGHGLSFTPTAQQMVTQHGLDPNLFAGKGSGASGKVTIEDVRAHIEQGTGDRGQGTEGTAASRPMVETPVAVIAPRVETAPSAIPTPNTQNPTPSSLLLTPERREEIVPMTRRRQTIALRLKEALNTAAMLTTFNEVDMTAVMEVRKRRKDSFKERHGVGLGFMSFFTKAAIGALKAFPHLNAEIRGTDIVVKKFYDIGIAVGTEEGLVVPVVRDADKRSFAGIEKEIGSLAGRAREGKLTLADMAGGTFTITNGGVFGSLMSTPILNTPQVGILGLHKIEERAVVVNGEIVIRPMMYLALSYDHRIVDGSEAVRFLVRLKELIEDPESLLLEG